MDTDAASRLEALIRDSGEALPLDRAAAELAAAEQEGVDPAAILARLDALAQPIRIPEQASPFEAIARINHHLFDTLGFAGDRTDYYAPRNSFLDQVLDRRKGLPILLSLLYVEVARRSGVTVRGVGFPGHFIVSPETEGEAWFVDPFHGGAIRRREQLLERLDAMRLPRSQADDFLAPSSARRILLRMTYNLKGSYVRLRRTRDALRQIDRILLLDSDRAEEHRDRALLLIELNDAEGAIVALRRYLAARPDADDAEPLAHLLAELEAG